MNNERLKRRILPWFLSEEGIQAYLRRDNYVVLDFETTNLTSGSAIDPGNDLILACWTVVKDGTERVEYRFGSEYDMADLVRDVQGADFVVAHNAKFEVQWLERCGVDPHDVFVYDTMVMEWVIHGNKKVPFDLDSTGKRYGFSGKESLVSKLIKNKVCPSRIPRSWLLTYCRKDVELCHAVFKAQKKPLDDNDLWHIALQRNLVVPALADIERQGLQLDKEQVYEEHKRLSALVETLGSRLDEITGGINLGSPKQLGHFLYTTMGFDAPLDNGGEVIKTGGGDVSTAAPALARLEAATDAQRTFLSLYREYNLADSMLSKNLNFFKAVCDERDGVFYGQLRQNRTANHRLASSGVKIKFKSLKKETAAQIQNLPRAYKRLFTAHQEGYVVTEYDGSQIEFRVAADLGHDTVAESDIVNGVDIHSFTRDTMNATYQRLRIDKEIDRQEAKSSSFAPLYGAFGKDAAEQEYAQAFRKKYCGIFQTQTDWTLAVADRKKLTTPYGLTFYWPNVKMHRSGYVSYSTEIFNLPISGLATGEIIPISLVFFWHRIRGMDVTIFNTVHDSIVVRQPEELVEETTAIAKQSMTHDVYAFLNEVYGYQFRVPLGFGCKSSKNWGTSSVELKWDVWPNGDERHQIEEKKVTRVVYDTRQ